MELPSEIEGVEVEPTRRRKVLTVNGRRWIILIPTDEYDERAWEYCLDTGETRRIM